jgi:hypothetical protein
MFYDRFLGTFAPFARAFDNPIAIACLRDLTGAPALPDLAVPFLNLRISFATSFPAVGLYFLVTVLRVVFAVARFFGVLLRFAVVALRLLVVGFGFVVATLRAIGGLLF